MIDFKFHMLLLYIIIKQFQNNVLVGESKYQSYVCFQALTLVLPSLFCNMVYQGGGFHQNDRKGCKRDVLDARGHFLLRFCAAGDKPVGRGLKGVFCKNHVFQKNL